jgi:hypothetical protein
VFVLPFAADAALDPWVMADADPEALVLDPLSALDDEFDVLPPACDADRFCPTFACHQFPVAVLVVLPEPGDGDSVPAGESEAGLVFADVFDALWVLAVPPLTLG